MNARLRMPGWGVLAGAVLACVVVTAGTSAAQGQAGDPIDWEGCGGAWECGFLEVPLDYGGEGDETLEIAVTRRPASDRDARIGVLLFNPGGPGGEAVEFARDWARILDSTITDRFDIVGFDPRGVGRSSPIVCHETLLEFTGLDQSPRDREAFERLTEAGRQFADDCMREYADVIPHLGTANAARDIDEIRQALGEERLNYVGYSYGTLLGAAYADRFPDRVRAFVLDGGVDNAIDAQEQALQQARGFNRALESFIADCEADDCALLEHGEVEDVFEGVVEGSREQPIPAPGADRDARPGEVFLGIVTPLYSSLTWPLLENAIDAAAAGDGSRLVGLADSYLGRRGDGEFPNSREANLAINCADRESAGPPQSYEEYVENLPAFEEVSPLLGGAFAVDLCDGWPAGSEPVGVPEAAGASPILVIGTTGDPATPYEWSEALAGQLESGVLLRHEGEGHTVYALGLSQCVNRVVNAYLVDGDVPEDGTTCAGSAAAVPPGADAPDREVGSETNEGGTWWVLAGGAAAAVIMAVVLVAVMLRRRGR